MRNAEKKQTFEETVAELDKLIARMETPGIPLEESVALYERGAKLFSEGQKLLETAEERVAALRADDGEEPAYVDAEDETARADASDA